MTAFHRTIASARSLAPAVSILALTAGFPAMAQQADRSAPQIDEIIISATKRPQTIFAAPVAVTAIDNEALEGAKIRDVNELQLLAPSLVVNSSLGPTQTVFTIRGIGTQSNNTGLEQSVGVFIDGVYRGRAGAATTDYLDIAQVEVLRGPQGTLYGRNTSAGVIGIRTAEPGSTPKAMADLSVGTYDYKQFRGVVSGPVAKDVLALSLATSIQRRAGFLEDVRTGERFDDRDRWSVRGQALWQATDSVRVRTIVDWTENHEKCCIAVPIFYGPTAQAIRALGGTVFAGTPGTVDTFNGVFPDAFTRKVAVNPTGEQPADAGYTDAGVSTEVTWAMDGMELTVLGAYRYFDTAPVQDSDFTNLNLLTAMSGQNIDEYSLEVRLASTGKRTVDWMVGAFHFDQSIYADQYLDYGSDLRRYLEAITPRVANPFAPGTTISPITLLERVTNRPTGTFVRAGRAVTDNYDYTAVSSALFGQATWNVNDAFSVTGGLRYSYEDKKASYDIQSVDALSQVVFAGPLTAFSSLRTLQNFPAANPFKGEFSEGNLSGTVSASYTVSKEASFYARYANGYKSGGLNLNRTAPGTVPGNPTVDPNKVKFDSEKVNSIEGGTKLRLFGRRLALNSALFYQTLDNFQNNIWTGNGFSISNAGSVEGYGLETDWTLSLTDFLSVDGGLVLQDIQFEDYKNAPPTAAQQAVGLTAQNLTGRPVPRTSDVTANVAATVKVPIGEQLGAGLRLDARYRSEYYTNGTLESVSKQGDTVTLNLTLSLADRDGAWSVELWGKNITDEKIYNQTLGTTFQSGSFSAFIEPPATWGVTAKVRF